MTDITTTVSTNSEAATEIQKFRAKVVVRAAKGLVDPESETIKKALVDLGFRVSSVRVGKIYEITLDETTKKDAENVARTICSRLLVNPTKDDYTLEVEPVGSSSNSNTASKP